MKKWKKWMAVTLISVVAIPQTIGGAVAASGTWKQDAKGWWYSYSDGSYAKSTWLQLGGKWYYFNANGYMVKNWQKIGGKWYFFGSNGAMRTGWQKSGGKWYFMAGSGAMRTGWLQSGGKTYYLGADGAMVTGTQTIDGKSYTFDSSGALTSSGSGSGGSAATGSSGLGSAKVGDIVKFGSYEQDNNTANGKEAIEWVVLEKKSDGGLMLISRYGLDAQPINEPIGPFTWESCTLRSWLNSTFYNTAFTDAQKSAIKTTDVVNTDNYFWGTKGGSNTKDKVFLLSEAEAKKYYVDDDGRYAGGDSHARCTTMTKYAIAQGAWELNNGKWWGNNAIWWLRSPGMFSNYGSYVFRNGYVSFDYDGIDQMKGIVRPVIVVNP